LTADRKVAELPDPRRLLPHRPPFLFVDRVIELTGERVVTIKNVTNGEPFFTGHFPGRPVVPGVLIVEALAQSAAILALSIAEHPRFFMLTGLDKVRIRRQVVPGDQLTMEVRLVKYRRPLWKMRCEARVEGKLAAEADLSAMEVEEELP
jgi:3-hydroxyacyl-[acyl-carrier-protein] dehydratase